MARQQLLEALREEVNTLASVMLTLTKSQFNAPTNCPPWTVEELLAHIGTGVGRVPAMLAGPAPRRAEVDAAGYFRSDHRYSAEVNAARLASAQAEAAGGGRHVTEELLRNLRATLVAAADQPADRTVLTRHGDPMTLDGFLVTRVVEVGVHGLDLADALDRPPWLVAPAASIIERLLGGAPNGVDRVSFIREATGRRPPTGRWPSPCDHSARPAFS